MRWKSFLTNSTDKAMSNDANKLKNRQEIRKYLVFAGMFLLFIGCMWWIFAPSEEDRQEKEKNAGFNTELPDPRGAGIEADKITAYEQADMRRREEEKMRTLEDFSAMADEPEPPAVEIESAPECQAAAHPDVTLEAIGEAILSPLPIPPTTTSTPRSAVSMKPRRKTPKRRH